MSLEFDLYPRADPIGGTKLVTFAHLQAGEARKEWQGTGSGKFILRGDIAEAQFIDPKGLQYVRVRDTAVSATVAVAGFFTDRGDFEALSVRRTRKLTFGGAGALSILARCVMDEQTYLDSEGGKDPFDDIWRLHAQGSWIGAVPHALGSFLHRVMRECTHADRPRQPLDGVTWDFDASTDSNGTPWPAYEGEFIANVGESVLSIVQRLMQLGLIVEMDPHTFELHAYVSNGTDRTGGAWGAGVVRFQTASAGTVVTGNIKSEAKRGIEAHVVRSDIITGSQDTYEWVNDAGADIVWEGLYRIDPADSAALTAAGNAQLSARSDAGDTARLRISYGNSPTTGRYRPITHVDTGDIASLHSGTGAMDWDESEKRVSAITWTKRRGGVTPDVWLDFGSTYRAFEDRQFQVGTGGGCICLRLCGGDPGNNVLLNLAAGSIKVSSPGPNAKTEAVDGDDATLSHWSSDITDGVDENWWAADLGTATGIVGYRVKQGYSVIGTAEPEGATEMRIYGSNIAGAWTWLVDGAGVLVADPAANDWTQVALFSGSTTGSDTGFSDFGGGSYRYWLLRASAGPAAGVGEGWNIQEFELWDASGTPGVSPLAARCDHGHIHNDLEGRSTAEAHPAGAVSYDNGLSGLTADDVQEAIDELTTGVGSAGATFRDISGNHRYPLWAHRGDIGSPDSYPENTVEALRQAILKGCHGVEFDVRLTSDAVWVLCHDATVDRTTDGTGTVVGKTAAQIAALNIDGGFGYDAGRHGTTLDMPTLAAVLDAMRPYDAIVKIQLNASSDPNATALAQYIVAQDYVSRAVIEVTTDSELAAVKAVSSALTTLKNNAVSGDTDADWGSYPAADITNLAFSTSRAPKRIGAYVSIADYGSDETTWFNNSWDRGASSFQTNNVDAALLLHKALMFGAGATSLDELDDVAAGAPSEGDMLRYESGQWVNTPGRWEPVTDGVDTFVWDGDEIVMAWKDT